MQYHHSTLKCMAVGLKKFIPPNTSLSQMLYLGLQYVAFNSTITKFSSI